jgi:hypothetical protein
LLHLCEYRQEYRQNFRHLAQLKSFANWWGLFFYHAGLDDGSFQRIYVPQYYGAYAYLRHCVLDWINQAST